MNWKISRDPFYGPLARKYGADFIVEAGFFEDTASEDASLYDVRTLCTPVSLLRANHRSAAGAPAVILATGAFCPIHRGHVELMARAREAVEAAGYSVIGGYISPGHDEYLRLKLGAQAWPAQRRLSLCGTALERSDWLMVDPWEALFRRVAVNFTDVIVRLRAYLHYHVDRNITLFYACGSDNARFSLTFAEQGHCVVVERPGFEGAVRKYRTHALNQNNHRVLWAERTSNASSTRVRAGESELIPVASTPAHEGASPRFLSMRLEGSEVAGGRTEAWCEYQTELRRTFEQWLPVRGRQPSQDARVPGEVSVLNLDPLTDVGIPLSISRHFDLGAYTQRGHVARPGADSIEAQLARIAQGEYLLVDDDVCSGNTVRWIRSRLPEGVRIRAVHQLIADEAPAVEREVVDSRDFLLGSKFGGLVVSLPSGRLGRVPYLFPYVDPTVRCSVPASEGHAFSVSVWRLNARFYGESDTRVIDLPRCSQGVLLEAGFDEQTRLCEVCAWHADTISRVAPDRVG